MKPRIPDSSAASGAELGLRHLDPRQMRHPARGLLVDRHGVSGMLARPRLYPAPPPRARRGGAVPSACRSSCGMIAQNGGRRFIGRPAMDREEFTALLGRWLEQAASGPAASGRPVIIGMSGAQGSGKTTLMHEVSASSKGAAVGRSRSRSTTSTSRTTSSSRWHGAIPETGTSRHRGYPGTHDVALGVTILTALKTLDAGIGPERCRATTGPRSRVPATACRTASGAASKDRSTSWFSKDGCSASHRSSTRSCPIPTSRW